jgi:hypothetical protein
MASRRPRTMHPYLTMPQLGAYLGFPTANRDESARKWCKRSRIPR